MLKFRSAPFDEDIEKATHENNLSEDWSLIMLICDKATNFQDGAKYCLKAILKRLYHPVPRVVLQTLTLLDACVKNCDRKFLLQVASSEFTNEVRKLLTKMHPSASNKLKELLQRWSLQEFKDDPELCIIPSLFYKLKSEGVEFPPFEKEQKKSPVLCTNPDGVSSQEEENDIIKAIEISLKDTGRYEVPEEYRNMTSAKPLPEPFKVRALYDFDAAEDNELTIKIGEIVLVSDNSNSSWWKGSNHRGEGLFPSSFVTEDLELKPEEPQFIEPIKVETVPDDVEEVEVKLDEEKIEKLINWLNDIDPTEETIDPDELLLLEKQCYAMTPLIEENLQEVDNSLAKLNLVNEKIMAAFDLFHSLSDHMSFNQPLKYYPGTMNQHVVQFPYPQVNIPVMPGSMLQQPPVPQSSTTTVPQSSSQMNSLPVSTVQSTVSQAPQMPSSANTNPVSHSEVSQSTNITSGTSTVASLPFNQANPLSNAAYMSGYYCVQSQAIPYPVPCVPKMPPPDFIQNPANSMTLPYAIPTIRFPVQYYYMNSNLPAQTVTTTTSTVTTQALETKPVETTTTTTTTTATSSVVNTNNSSIPSFSNYSNDLSNLYFNSANTSENHSGKTDIHSDMTENLNDRKVYSESKTELLLKKNL